MQPKNDKMIDLITALKSEMNSPPVTGSRHGGDVMFCFETKDGGRVYSTAVRELYYTLLTNQLPPAKISGVIRSVFKTFIPSVDVDKLKLPGKSCASYMRREELTTVNLAHNAAKLLDEATSDAFNLNCDGTTLSQKKLQGTAINGMVISVNEIADGSAGSMIADLSLELQKLREVARALCLPKCR